MNRSQGGFRPQGGSYHPPAGRGPGGRAPGGGGGGRGEEDARLPTPAEVRYFVGDALNPKLLESMEPLARKIISTDPTVNPAQLRRFFGEMLVLDRRLAADPRIPDVAIQAQMALLKARAAYALKRDTINAPLLQFFVDHAAAVRTRKEFDAFRRVFETLIAYHAFHAKDNKKERN